MKVGLASKWGPSDQSCGVVHTKALLGLLDASDVQKASPGTGNGTRDEPFRDLNMQNWRWLAEQKATADPIFYSVGKRVLVRWGTKMGGLVNYISDMTDFTTTLDDVLKEPDPNKVKKEFAEADVNAKINPDLAPYHKKSLRVGDMTDEDAASRCRSLLMDSNTDCSACPEIASSFCSLFVAEAHRAPRTFLVSLMLLDLVQSQTTYGVDGGKKYTWKSMLAHSTAKGEAINVEGRGQNKGIKLAKHPMAGIGTVNLSNQMDNWGVDNAVRDRVVSLMSIWVGHYLQKTHADRTYYLLRTGDKSNIKGQVGKIKLSDKKCDLELLEQCKGAVTQRCLTPGVLIGGTSLDYMNFEGEPV